jgi:hypothetical protein
MKKEQSSFLGLEFGPLGLADRDDHASCQPQWRIISTRILRCDLNPRVGDLVSCAVAVFGSGNTLCPPLSLVPTDWPGKHVEGAPVLALVSCPVAPTARSDRSSSPRSPALCAAARSLPTAAVQSTNVAATRRSPPPVGPLVAPCTWRMPWPPCSLLALGAGPSGSVSLSSTKVGGPCGCGASLSCSRAPCFRRAEPLIRLLDRVVCSSACEGASPCAWDCPLPENPACSPPGRPTSSG